MESKFIKKAEYCLYSDEQKNAVGMDDPPEYIGQGPPSKKGEKWKLVDLLKAAKLENISVHI